MDNNKNKLLEACKFSMNEIVLCYEPDPMKAKMLYDAKILDADVTKDDKGKKVFEYYIHFQGWNKSWDRWILENKILKANVTNRTLQTKLYDEAIRQKKRKPKSSKLDSGDEKDDKSVTSMGSGNSDDIKVSLLPSVSLDIPKVLAVRLEDDCYNIKRKKKLVHIPRKPTVNDIFNEYYTHCNNIVKTPEGRNMSLRIIYEMVHALNTYFNYYLFSLLLYNFEREQYHNFFPGQQKEMLNCLSPRDTPLMSKLVSPNSIVFSDSSRPNSRTSSFCEDAFSSVSAPLLKEVLKTKSSKKRRGDGKSSSVDETLTQGGNTKRKRNTASCSSMAGSKESLINTPQKANIESDGKVRNRETRSAKKIVPPERVYPKEEKAIKPMEILEENIIDMERTTTRSRAYAHKDASGTSSSTSKKNVLKYTKGMNDIPSLSKVNNDKEDVLNIAKGISNSKNVHHKDDKYVVATKVFSSTYADQCDEGKTKGSSASKEIENEEDVGIIKETSCTSNRTYVDREENGKIKETLSSKNTHDKEDVDLNKETLSTSKKSCASQEGKSSKHIDHTEGMALNKETLSTSKKSCAAQEGEPSKHIDDKEDVDINKETLSTSKKSCAAQEGKSSKHIDHKEGVDANRDTLPASEKTFNDQENEGKAKESLTLEEVDEENNDKKFVKYEEQQSNATDELEEDKESVDCTNDSCFDNASSMESNNSRLRRSVRDQKCSNTVSECDEQETLPMGSTAKSLQETFKCPLRISNVPQGCLNDKTYMVYPQSSNGDTPADIYGLEHLLRLFVKLPVLLSASHIEERKILVILKYVSQFLEYLSKRTDLFVDSTIVYSESII